MSTCCDTISYVFVQSFQKTEQGFAQVERELRRVEDELTAINHEMAALAALGSLQYTDEPGWQVSIGGAVSTRHGVPAAAVGLGYQRGGYLAQIGVASPTTGDVVVSGSITLPLN